MGIKDLVVHLDGRRGSAARLDAALALGRSFAARVTAVCLVGEPFGPFIELPPDTLYRQRLEADADDVLARAVARAGRLGVEIDARRATATSERLPERLALHVRHADLAIVGQPDPDLADATDRPLLEAAFLDTGRPALVLPYAGALAVPPRWVLAAWDGSREATRALHDALPFLRRAARVTVAIVGPERLGDRVGERPGADIAAHLARHGVEARVVVRPGGGLDASDVLLSLAADEGADLVAMGGYGHARLRERVLGGTTRGIIERATVPVLLSH